MVRRHWIALSVATAAGLLFAAPGVSNGGGWRTALGSLVQWWSWGFLSVWIIAADGRLPYSGRQLSRRVLAHFGLSLAFTAAFVCLVYTLRALIGLENPAALASMASMFLWNWLVYLAIAGGWQAFQYYERYLSGELRVERLERQFAEARLNALRIQLEPHFLFNALNTISSQVERDPRMARKMIEHLGDLLRATLDSRDKKEVLLAEELESLDHYLAIQKIRFGGHVKVEMQVAAETKFALVPGLLLQPLVENAIRHGISGRASGGTVTVTAARVSGLLEIRVADDGVGLPAGWDVEASQGLGLSVTRQRVAADGFAIRNLAAGGVEVKVLLPFRLMETR